MTIYGKLKEMPVEVLTYAGMPEDAAQALHDGILTWRSLANNQLACPARLCRALFEVDAECECCAPTESQCNACQTNFLMQLC